MTANRNLRRRADPTPADELPELPPLDDDSEDAERSDDASLDDEVALDDESSASRDDGSADDAEPEGFEDLVGEAPDSSSYDDECGPDSADRAAAAAAELALDSGERGLLEDSDEGRGDDLSASEVGILADDGADHADDGGQEGVLDASFGLSLEQETDARGTTEDDDGVGEDLDVGALPKTSAERWPARASVRWELCTGRAPPWDGDRSLPTRTSDLEIDVSSGQLVLVRRGRREIVPETSHVSCAGILASSSSTTHVVAAAHDAARDVGAIILVKVTDDDAPQASLVLEFDAQDLARTDPALEGEPDLARIEQLALRAKPPERSIIAAGAFGIRQIRPAFPLS